MFADTAAITVLGAELSRIATDLDAVAAALPAAAPAVHAALGPVGAEFSTALTRALATAAQRARDLGADLVGASATAGHTATAYADAEHRAVAALGG
ncbi:type VII secretion target [Mycobacterium sp. NPDC003323]